MDNAVFSLVCNSGYACTWSIGVPNVALAFFVILVIIAIILRVFVW